LISSSLVRSRSVSRQPKQTNIREQSRQIELMHEKDPLHNIS
jgi:hypothetical protein